MNIPFLSDACRYRSCADRLFLALRAWGDRFRAIFVIFTSDNVALGRVALRTGRFELGLCLSSGLPSPCVLANWPSDISNGPMGCCESGEPAQGRFPLLAEYHLLGGIRSEVQHKHGPPHLRFPLLFCIMGHLRGDASGGAGCRFPLHGQIVRFRHLKTTTTSFYGNKSR